MDIKKPETDQMSETSDELSAIKLLVEKILLNEIDENSDFVKCNEFLSNWSRDNKVRSEEEVIDLTEFLHINLNMDELAMHKYLGLETRLVDEFSLSVASLKHVSPLFDKYDYKIKSNSLILFSYIKKLMKSVLSSYEAEKSENLEEYEIHFVDTKVTANFKSALIAILAKMIQGIKYYTCNLDRKKEVIQKSTPTKIFQKISQNLKDFSNKSMAKFRMALSQHAETKRESRDVAKSVVLDYLYREKTNLLESIMDSNEDDKLNKIKIEAKVFYKSMIDLVNTYFEMNGTKVPENKIQTKRFWLEDSLAAVNKIKDNKIVVPATSYFLDFMSIDSAGKTKTVENYAELSKDTQAAKIERECRAVALKSEIYNEFPDEYEDENLKDIIDKRRDRVRPPIIYENNKIVTFTTLSKYVASKYRSFIHYVDETLEPECNKMGINTPRNVLLMLYHAFDKNSYNHKIWREKTYPILKSETEITDNLYESLIKGLQAEICPIKFNNLEQMIKLSTEFLHASSFLVQFTFSKFVILS